MMTNNHVTEQLQQLLHAEQDMNLAEAALLLAKDEYPTLDIDDYLGRLDDLASRVRARLSANANVEETLVTMNQVLFDEFGFAGNTDDYYDPRNSFLNDVLDRKLGIPITLCILYMETAHRLGLDLEGVSFPGHFLVKFSTAEGELVLDPFSGGMPVSEEELVERLEETYGEQAAVSMSVPELLATADKKDILVRMLRNLKGTYLRREQLHKALTVVNRILQIAPGEAEEWRSRGELHERLECFRAALEDYRRHLELSQDHAARLRPRLIELERRVARFN
jgi:regulator of sirC expression with transglutaminase-like and TPR domain